MKNFNGWIDQRNAEGALGLPALHSFPGGELTLREISGGALLLPAQVVRVPAFYLVEQIFDRLVHLQGFAYSPVSVTGMVPRQRIQNSLAFAIQDKNAFLHRPILPPL